MIAHALVVPDRDRHPAALPMGVVVSVLLHALIAFLLITNIWARLEPQRKSEFVMEFVQLPEPPKPQAKPAPPAPSLPPTPVPRFEDAPKIGDVSTPVAPPAEQPRPAPPPPPSRPEIIVGGGLKAPPAPHAAAPLPKTTTRPSAEPLASERLSAQRQSSAEPAAVASQSVQDFILKQVAQRWLLDVHSARYRNLRLSLAFVLLPDGTLGPPFGKSDPWDLKRMLAPEAYEVIQQPGEETIRSAIITFLQAIRQAQPFRLPPDEASYKSRVLPLSFRMDDLPQ